MSLLGLSGVITQKVAEFKNIIDSPRTTRNDILSLIIPVESSVIAQVSEPANYILRLELFQASGPSFRYQVKHVSALVFD